MSEENRSETPSWEEWVEQLTRLPEEEQLTELLAKARTLKDENRSLQDTLDTKDKEIQELTTRMQQSGKKRNADSERIEKEIAAGKASAERKARMQVSQEYVGRLYRMRTLFLASLAGCLVLIITLASYAEKYMQDVINLGVGIISGTQAMISVIKHVVKGILKNIAGKTIRYQTLWLCVEGVVYLLIGAILIAAILGIAYLLVRQIKKCWLKNAALLLFGIIVAVAGPMMLAGILGWFGINASAVSIIGILLLVISVSLTSK